MKNESDHAILATIVVAYAFSTVLTGMSRYLTVIGLLFLGIGYFKLGAVLSFFPRHILIGCIAGVGFFLFLTGFTLSLQQEVPDLAFLFQLENLKLWGTSFGIAIFLLVVSLKLKHRLLVPLFYTFLPVVFYIFAFLFGSSIDELRDGGWLFKFDGQESTVSPIEYWTYFDFPEVNIQAIIVCLPTIISLSFFGLLHVPINLPALSISSGQVIDINKEIVAHGKPTNLIHRYFQSCQRCLWRMSKLPHIHK
jgi:MFS superfamily sulfate permease-like transporter